MAHNFDAYKTAQIIVDNYSSVEDEEGEPLGDDMVLKLCLTHVYLLSLMGDELDLPDMTIQCIENHVMEILKRPL